jgi:hypothetical protein
MLHLDEYYLLKYYRNGNFRKKFKKHKIYGNLSHYEIINVNLLKNIYMLDLCDCQGIKDVSALRNVHILNLSYCSKIKDVSMLGNVHTLNLSYCSKIKDVSMFRN